MREADITESGAVIGGRHLRYADDTALGGKSPQEINNISTQGKLCWEDKTTEIECPKKLTDGSRRRKYKCVY